MRFLRRKSILAYIFLVGLLLIFLPAQKKDISKSDCWQKLPSKTSPRKICQTPVCFPAVARWVWSCSRCHQRALRGRWHQQCVNNFRSASHWFLWELWPSLYWRRCHSFERLFTYLLRSAKWKVLMGFGLTTGIWCMRAPECEIEKPSSFMLLFAW